MMLLKKDFEIIMKRYDIYQDLYDGPGVIVDEDPDGEWVKFEDVEKLQAAYDVSEKQFDELVNRLHSKDFNESCC